MGASPPFFALDGAVFDGAELRAHVAAETDPGSELGPASAAEIVRHALVAGAACLALARPDETRAFYLTSSVDATFFSSPAVFGERVAYSALIATQSPVGGSAQIEARVDRALVSRLKVSFAVVEEGLFTRLFHAHRTATYGDVGSYEHYQPLSACSHDGHRATGRLTIEPSSCRGHFHQYPSLPVSSIVGQLVALGARLMPGRFRVAALRVRAPAVAWSGEELELNITRAAGPWNLTGQAVTGERSVGSLDLAISGSSVPRR